MKNYLYINITDVGDFHSTDNEKDLQLECEIKYKTGIINSRSRNPLNLNLVNTYTPQQNHKFYFLPGVTVPRVKLKSLNSSHGIRVVRDMEEADVIFTGAKTVDTLIDYHWEYNMLTEDLKQWLATAHQKGYIDDYYYQKFETAVEFYTNEDLLISTSTARLVYDKDISFYVNIEDKYRGSERFTFVKDEYIDLYEKIKDKQLCEEDAIYEYINGEDAIEIDKSMYSVLCDMFESSDTDNHLLAMEIMANCDYKKSILHLCYLLHDNRQQIENRRERTHVNFKSMLNYMGVTPGNVYLDKDNMVELMLKKKLFTKEYFFDMCDKFSHEISNYSSEHFKVKLVSSSDQINEFLNEELIHQVKSDYQKTITPEDEFKNTELDII